MSEAPANVVVGVKNSVDGTTLVAVNSATVEDIIEVVVVSFVGWPVVATTKV